MTIDPNLTHLLFLVIYDKWFIVRLSLFFFCWLFLWGRRKYFNPLKKAANEESRYTQRFSKLSKIVNQLSEPSSDTIRTYIATEYSEEINIQKKYNVHISNFVLWGLVGTLIGLLIALSQMNTVFSKNMAVEDLVTQFQHLLPQMSLAFISTIAGIVLTMWGRMQYHEVDLNPIFLRMENQLIQEHKVNVKSRNEIFEDFLEVFNNHFRKEFLTEFSNTIKHGFNEGVKDFGNSITTMTEQITGTMAELGSIGEHLYSFSEAFQNASKTIQRMDKSIENLNQHLNDSTSLLREATDILIKQTMDIGTIGDNIGRVEKVSQSLTKNLELSSETHEALTIGLQEHLEEVRQLVESTNQQEQKMGDLTTKIQSSVTQWETLSSSLSSNTQNQEALNDTLVSLQKDLNSTVGHTTGFRELLGEISKQNSSTHQGFESIKELLVEMRDTHSALMELQKELIESSKGISDNFNSVADAMKSWGSVQDNSLKRMEALSEKLLHGDGKQDELLEKAIGSMNQIEKELTPALNNFSGQVNKFDESIRSMSRYIREASQKDLRDLAQAIQNLKSEIETSTISTMEFQTKAIATMEETYKALITPQVLERSRNEVY